MDGRRDVTHRSVGALGEGTGDTRGRPQEEAKD